MTYELDDGLELDLDRHEVRRGRTLIALQPKAFDLLAHLVQHRDRVVEKTELQVVLWPGETVTESSLTFCINLVRRALGDSGRAQRSLRTVRGTGYRFVGRCIPRASRRTRPRILAREWTTPFVGRTTERAALRACLDGARCCPTSHRRPRWSPSRHGPGSSSRSPCSSGMRPPTRRCS